MRSRLRAVSASRSEGLGNLFEALEAAAPELPSNGLLEAIALTGRLDAVLRARYAALSAPPAALPAAEGPRYLNTDQVAAYFGVSPSTVRRLCEKGLLPCSRLSEGVVRFDRQDLDAFAASRKEPA
jgi:excisionase family DNA binding protein